MKKIIFGILIIVALMVIVYMQNPRSDIGYCPPPGDTEGFSAPQTFYHPYLPFIKSEVSGGCGPKGWIIE